MLIEIISFFELKSEWEKLQSILICMNKSRQTNIVQIYDKMSSRNNAQEVVEPPSGPKREDIYESGQESAFNIDNPHKASKKESKIVTFLSKIDPEFKEELSDFLIQNKEDYERKPSKSICLYEDVLFLFGYKTSEEEIRSRKKGATEKIIKELEEMTNKKAVTIKERVEKKLANLSVDEIRYFMQQKMDISFNDKKQLNNKPNPSHPNSKASLSEADEPHYQESKKTSKSAIASEIKPIIVQAEQMVSHIESKAKKAEEDSSKKSMFNKPLYKYGKSSISENIKFFYSPATKTLVPFKKSQIDTLTQSRTEQNIAKGEGEQKIDIPTLDSKGKIKVSRQVIEAMKGYFQQNHVSKEPEVYISYIENVKLQTKKAIMQMQVQSREDKEENIRHIAVLKEKLAEINKLQDEMKKKATSKNAQKLYSEDETYQQRPQDKQKQAPTTGKKSLPDEQPASSQPQTNFATQISPEQKDVQLRRLKEMLSNNQTYFQIVKQDNSKFKYYAWNKEEDEILWKFKFSPNVYRSEMICLLRYKSMDMVRERIGFLGMDLDQKLENDLAKLNTPEGYYNSNSIEGEREVEGKVAQMQM